MTCVGCGFPLPEDVFFCTQCGARQAVEGKTVPPAAVDGGDYRTLFFMRAVLTRFSDGAFFKRFFAVFLKALAAVCAVAGLAGSIYLVDTVWRWQVGGFVGYIVFLPVLLVGLYAIVHAILVRARSVAAIPAADYAVVPICSVLLKLLGEAGAVLSLVGGVLGCFTAWFGTGQAQGVPSFLLVLPWILGSSGGFLAGLGRLILGAIAAVAWLTVLYFLAEQMLALVDIAVHSREIAGKAPHVPQ